MTAHPRAPEDPPNLTPVAETRGWTPRNKAQMASLLTGNPVSRTLDLHRVLGGYAMLVQHILKGRGDAPVISVKPGTLVSNAVSILAERRIGVLVVSADGEHPEGILSERDIVRSLALRGAGCLSETVDEMMTRNPVCASLRDKSDEVLKRMTDGRFRHMPVIADGKLVGIVSIGDVVHARLSELSMEKDALQGMIMGH